MGARRGLTSIIESELELAFARARGRVRRRMELWRHRGWDQMVTRGTELVVVVRKEVELDEGLALMVGKRVAI